MRVCRIVKAEFQTAVGNIVLPYKNERNYSEKRSVVEDYLEDMRKSEFSAKLSRLNSLFVFPKDDKLQERAFQWANTFAPLPNSSCIVNLLELEVDNVEWHNSRSYEDLYFLLNGKKYGMRNINSTKESLAEEYWQDNCDMNAKEVEGLVEKGKVLSITPYVVTHNRMEKLEL